PAKIAQTINDIIEEVSSQAQSGDAIVIMSNGGFGGIHGKLVRALKAKFVM
ncbi:MAG: UDP-N-acetylmuramate:L-alanyl-gamma-D-glutamyl-meso-diaminopimelate ligase, partial [Moraxellaceae bacterium]|nr:UDP-N-acetylmuramate:L-alanyl-gamma-D-glutamyl-meso-diaminopimelate ligase [Moraxellaceae bacterium]